MADFCLQCNLDMHFGPYSDFDHLQEMYGPGTYIGVLCEGCGPTVVDLKGRCVSGDCLCAGHLSLGEREALRRAEKWVKSRSGPLGPVLRLRDRLLGTPWHPGAWHYWRWRWYDWRAGPTDFGM